jgi:hypothetical protein
MDPLSTMSGPSDKSLNALQAVYIPTALKQDDPTSDEQVKNLGLLTIAPADNGCVWLGHHDLSMTSDRYDVSRLERLQIS